MSGDTIIGLFGLAFELDKFIENGSRKKQGLPTLSKNAQYSLSEGWHEPPEPECVYDDDDDDGEYITLKIKIDR